MRGGENLELAQLSYYQALEFSTVTWIFAIPGGSVGFDSSKDVEIIILSQMHGHTKTGAFWSQ